jgi:hypothetical protein
VQEETTTNPPPAPETTTQEQPGENKPTTTDKQEEPKTTNKDQDEDPKTDEDSESDPKTEDENSPEPTTKKDEAPVTIPPAAVTAKPQETIEGVTDNTLHTTTDSDGNNIVVPVLFGPSCLIFCEHVNNNGPGGIVLWGIGECFINIVLALFKVNDRL